MHVISKEIHYFLRIKCFKASIKSGHDVNFYYKFIDKEKINQLWNIWCEAKKRLRNENINYPSERGKTTNIKTKKFLFFSEFSIFYFFKPCQRNLLQYFELLEFFETRFIFIFNMFSVYFILGCRIKIAF